MQARTTGLLILLVFAAAAVAGCAARAPLARTPDAVTSGAASPGPALSELPVGWYRAGAAPGEYDMGADTSSPRQGHDTIAIESKPHVDHSPDKFATVMRAVDAAPYLGKRVRLSGLVKARGVEGWAGLWMRVDGDPAARMLAFDNMQSRPIRATSDWTRYDVVLDVDAAATKVAFGTLLAGSGDIWFDDLSLDVVETSLPTTGATVTEVVAARTTGLGSRWALAGSAPAQYVASADAAVHRGGAASLSLESRGAMGHDFGTAMQMLPAGDHHASRVRFSAYVKAEKVRGWAGLWVRVDGQPGAKPLAFDNMEDRAIAGTVDWTRYTVVLDVAPGAREIALGILLAGEGHVWMDDVTLEEF